MRLPKIPRRITPTFGFSILTRAVREGLSTRRFGKTDVQSVITFFGRGDCAMVRSRGRKRTGEVSI
jgi:hypothetical protein